MQVCKLTQTLDQVKKEMAEASHSRDSQLKSLRAEQEQNNKQLEEQLAQVQESLSTASEENHKLQKELDKVR